MTGRAHLHLSGYVLLDETSRPAMAAVRAAVVTHGRHGASWYSATELVNVPAPESCETDSTGAGDAFNAGLLASWLAGNDPAEALRAGVSPPGQRLPPGSGRGLARDEQAPLAGQAR